jgi:type IV pilus assembly protein PilO
MIVNVREARQKFVTVIIVLLALDLVAAGLLMSPLGRSRAAREQEYDAVRNQLLAKRREAVPLQDVSRKLTEAKGEITAFYDNRLPSQYSTISEELGRLATENGVKLSSVRYTSEDTELPRLQHVQIDTALTGDYLRAVKFINALEREQMFFIVDSIDLAEEQGGTVRLQLRLETYRRLGG